MFKNVASQKIAVFAFDSTTNLPKTGDAANITLYVSKDYGTVTVLTDTSATEMDSTNAKGWYLFDVAQAETNADALLFTGKSSTSNISVVGQLIYTTPANFTSQVIDSSGRVDVSKIAGTSQTAGDIYALDTLIAGYIDTEVAAIKAKTDNLPASPAAVGSAMTLTSAYDFAKGTTAMAESYAADGAAATPAQMLHMIWSMLAEKNISSTTLTAKKLDGSTTAMTFTLNDASSPTSITRAS